MIEEGGWGRRLRLFYHIFYGEGFVVRPEQAYTRQPDSRPFAGELRYARSTYNFMYHSPSLLAYMAGIVWSGEGTINSQPLNTQSQDHREFLVTPGYAMQLFNGSPVTDLMVFCVFPLNR